MSDMKEHLRSNADPHGNLWCHCQGCIGTYTPYRINTWGLRNTETNRENEKEMVQQQVNNILRHLQKAHGMSVLTACSDALIWHSFYLGTMDLHVGLVSQL